MDLILSSILGPVCERVINTAIEEYRSVRDVKEEIKKLRTTVDMIKGALEDAERKQVESSFIRKWLKELKQVLFDAEDVFDEIATDEALEKNVKDGTSRLSKVRKLIFSVDHSSSSRDIARQVKDINKKFDDISNDKERLGLHVSDETVIRPIRRPPPDTSSLLPKEARIIGRDDEMRKIKELLLLEYSVDGTVTATSDYNKNVEVISVVGMGGVGKTTLVQHAYNNTEVGNYFQLRMWVCVSNYFDENNIAVKIIEAASKFEKAKELRECSNCDVVKNGLRDLIKGKRFLLVLDDVWEEDRSKWDRLYTPLSYGARGSKIIMTTRSQTVSNITKGTPIFLKDLPSEDLVTILQNYAFDGHDPDTQLAQVGREIVKKLKGSPLAAMTIGRLLNANLDVRHWRNILNSEAWVSPNSEDSILPILKLSYDHLPGHLKQCFALCSLFPEDHWYKKDELVQLWTAHQLIRIGEGFSHVESEGGVYLDKLVHMSLFEKSTSPYSDTYVMHDLIHNLADSVSKDDCLRLEDNRQNGTISETIRHVSIASDTFDLPKIEELCNKYKNMRTLLFLCGCKFQLDSHLDSIFMKLQRLRVLDLSGCGIKELHASIGTLKHLRFLDLSKNGIIKLPDSLCNLHNLQVLNLDYCQQLRALPGNMSALINLRHLYANGELVIGIKGLGKLTALHELTFVCGMQPMKELADMGMLRRLHIWHLEEVKSREEAAGSRLDKKEHLDELMLQWELPWSDVRDVDDRTRLQAEEVLDGLQPPPHSSLRRLTIGGYGGSRSPRWMEDQSWLRDSCFLRTLELYNCKNWEVLPPLGQLLCLDSLKIEVMRRVRRIGAAFMGCCRQLPQGGFPSLQVLVFEHMEEWEEWEVPLGTDIDDGGVDDQVLPEAPPLPLFLALLRELTISHCPKLRQLPPLPPTLTKLKIENVGLTHLPEWRLPPSSSLPCCCPSSSSSPYSLCSLEIADCPNLEGDDDGEDDQVLSDAPHHHRPLFLARLQKLTIWNCPKLRQLPPLPPTLTELEIWRVGLTHLPEWLLPPSSSSSLLPCCSSSSPCSLSFLEIRDCPELTSLVDGLLRHPLPNLVKLEINNCRGLVSLPPDTFFGHLPSLEWLWVESCPKLAWPSTCELPSVVEEEDIGLPPSLKSIIIEEVCGEVMDHIMLAIVGSHQKLARLTYLKIEGCFSTPPPPTLRRSLPSSLQELSIWNNDQLDDETLSAWLRGLTSLRQLSIVGCPAVTSLPRAEVLSHLTALKKLEIKRLKALSSFGGGIHCLVSLEELIILDCPELLDIITTTAADSSRPSSSSSSALPSPARSSVGTSTTTRIRRLEISRSSMQQIRTWLLQCPSLQVLRISYFPQLTGFGGNHNDGGDDVGGDLLEAALLNLSGTLQRLQFWSCENLRSLPPRLRCLFSLQSLEIQSCPQIRSLPIAGLPESLRDLIIYQCPALEERCKEGVGSDWPLISHIPRRRIHGSSPEHRRNIR